MAEENPLQFSGLQGETLIKTAGEIAGQGFVLENLQNCEVYLLDYSGQVQIDDCTDCNIVVGPCAGAVFIRDCAGCNMQLAAQQVRTRDCKDLTLGLYCSTQPSIESSTNLIISCWRAAYPGLTEQFAQAGLDALANMWDQVFDFNAAGESDGNYTVDKEFAGWLEVPNQEGQAQNPVLASNGAVYGETDGFAAFGDDDVQVVSRGDISGDTLMLGSKDSQMEENSPLMIWYKKNQTVLDAKEKEEQAKKAEIQKKASAHLDKYYAERKKGIEKRSKLNLADNTARSKLPSVQGATPWEKVTSVIDFNYQGQTRDVTRFKQVLIMAKTKKIAIKA